MFDKGKWAKRLMFTSSVYMWADSQKLCLKLSFKDFTEYICICGEWMISSGSKYMWSLSRADSILESDLFPFWFEMYQTLVRCFILTKLVQYWLHPGTHTSDCFFSLVFDLYPSILSEV